MSAETTTYTLEYDPDTREYVADAGGQQYTSDVSALAWHWLAAQIIADETATPAQPAA